MPAIEVIAPLIETACAISLSTILIYSSYRFLRWLWTKLPTNIVSLPPEQLDRTLGLLLALALFPKLILFGQAVIISLVKFVPRILEILSTIRIPSRCRGGDDDINIDQARCVSDFCSVLMRSVRSASEEFVGVLNLSTFPTTDFIWFLLVAAISVPVIAGIHTAPRGPNIGLAFAFVKRTFPALFWRRFSFAALVLISFYLALCALLAIPLFQEKSQSQQLTVESLSKALDANIIKVEQFDQSFPKDVPPLRELALSKAAEAYADGAKAIFDTTIQSQKTMWQDQQNAWSILRAKAMTAPSNWRDQAINGFAAGLEISSGRKQTAQHYNDLFLWHQRLAQLTRDALSKCQGAVGLFSFTAFQTSDTLRVIVEATSPGPIAPSIGESLQQLQQNFYSTYSNAIQLCQFNDDEISKIPARPSFASALGPVGSWTRWLLDTGQMPVVIIVGLVGFSLLGATVSRAVRAKDGELRAGLSLDELLSVVAGGVTAAIVVFLAAYGGLAVLGSSSNDPNPYVVFVTCLVGAVYSEDVWSWARKRLPAVDSVGSDGTPQKPS